MRVERTTRAMKILIPSALCRLPSTLFSSQNSPTRGGNLVDHDCTRWMNVVSNRTELSSLFQACVRSVSFG